MIEHNEVSPPTSLLDEPDTSSLESTWSLLRHAAPGVVGASETQAAWIEARTRLNLDPAVADPDISPKSRPSDGWASLLRAAAVAGLLLAGAAGLYQIPVTHSAAPGERVALTLPDGSGVTLNSGSTLRHGRAFSILPGWPSASRRVHLSGEAFFDVQSDARSFQVVAEGALVQVLGTRFNVRARPSEENPSVRVSVEEGRVQMSTSSSSRVEATVILEAGESGLLEGSDPTPRRSSVRAERIGAWRTGGLVAVDETLGNILSELTLRYGAPVELAGDAERESRLSAYYQELGSLESVLADLATQQSLNFRRTADGWEVF